MVSNDWDYERALEEVRVWVRVRFTKVRVRVEVTSTRY